MVLNRIKPSPFPPITPVPEYLADKRLSAVYADTKAVLQVPWMGVVTMAFAHYPIFYDVLWSGMRPVAFSREFIDACLALREAAEAEAETLHARSLENELEGLGYAEREVDEIRARIETFSHGNMPYLLIATAARLLLEGKQLSSETTVTAYEGRHCPDETAPLVLIEPHHADVPTRALYDDIKATLGLPFVNTDYRALARWPSYFALAWSDLQPRIATEAYRGSLQRVHGVAVDLVSGLPNPERLLPDTVRDAADADASLAEVLEVVRLFQWLLPGLVVNVAHFRRQLL